MKTKVLERKRYIKKIIKHEAICEGYEQTVIFLKRGLGNFQTSETISDSAECNV